MHGNQVPEVKMTLHIGLIKSSTAVTTYNDISSYMTEAKMIVHIARRFLNLYTTVTTNEDISSYVTEAEMTVHIGLLNLCAACASTPYKLDFFHFSYSR